MKEFTKQLLLPAAISTALLGGPVSAAGLMTPVGQPDNQLQIESHHVNVHIQDGYAITEVDQVFSNHNDTDLEAVYSFPVPEKGAVSEFTVWIDGKPVIGEVLEKKRAKKIYEEERAAGRETGLTEKKEHYRFEVRVSPVRAHQDAKIRLVYMQPTDIDTGIGRYVYPLEEGETDQQALNFWSSDPVVQQDFSFNMNLRSSYPVDAVRLPQHPAAVISSLNDQEWSASIQNGATITEGQNTQTAANFRLDKDIVAYWKLQPNLPGRVDLVTYREPGNKRGTFMMTLTPGDDLAKITQGRDWMFVLDISGSMSGKYATLADGVQRALGQLNPEDRFQIVLFDDRADRITSHWIPATQANVQTWSNKLDQHGPRGGTNLYAGLKTGLNELDADRTSAIVLVTDGEANVGETEKKKFLQLLEQYDARLFTAVMGNGSNRPLLNAMAKASNGFAVSVSNSDDITGKLMEFTSKVTHEAMHDVELDISGIKTKDLTPEKIGSLYRGEQLTVMGHYWGDGEAQVRLKTKISGQEKEYKTQFAFPADDTRYPELERLWAFASIEDLQDKVDYFGDDADFKNAITDLAVENSIVTNYTSMVVMRDEQFEARGIERKNKERRAKEVQAQQQRQAAPVQNHRVDSSAPAFSNTAPVYRSSGSGGGAFGWEWLMLLAAAPFLRLRKIQ